MKLNKALFEADDGMKGGGTPATPPTEPPKAEATTQATEPKPPRVEFTAEQQKKIEEIIAAKVAKKQADIDEAARLAAMNEDERIKDKLNKYEKEINAYKQKELVSQYKLELTTKGLSADFAEIIPASDAEAAKKAVDALVKFKADTESALNAKIKSLEDELTKANLRQPSPKGVTPQETKTTTLKNIY